MPNRTVLVLILALPLTGCLFRSRKVQQQYSTAPLLTTSQQELIASVNAQAAQIKSMQATVDIDTSVGGVKKGKVTDYQQIRGYVLARKPAMLRMIGLLPIVRNRAFDMVSDGQDFKLWIPPKNRFIVGRNDIPTPNTQQPLENIRPQQIYDAILLHEIDAQREIAVLENDFEIVSDSKGHRVQQPDYELDVIGKGETGWYLARKIIFSRIDLQPHRQLIYDEKGNLVTDVRYDGHTDYSGIKFPAQIEIWRPQEEYDITLTVIKMEMNPVLGDDKFALQPPAGVEVVHLGEKQPAAVTPQAREESH